MTREEALQILDTIPTIGEQVDALEMAIKALSQEPWEICCATCKHDKPIQKGYECEYQNECLTEGKRGKYEFAYSKYEPKRVKPELNVELNELEPCDDAISREAVVDDFIEWREKLEYAVGEDYSGVHLLNVAIQKIWDIPPVRPQEQTGHWIRQDNTKEPLYGWYFCSECNSVIGDKTKFCSNCGARMESEDKE